MTDGCTLLMRPWRCLRTQMVKHILHTHRRAPHTISYMSVISLRFIRLFCCSWWRWIYGVWFELRTQYGINYVRVCLANPTCSVGRLTFRCRMPLLPFLNSIFYSFLLIALSDISFQFDSKALCDVLVYQQHSKWLTWNWLFVRNGMVFNLKVSR